MRAKGKASAETRFRRKGEGKMKMKCLGCGHNVDLDNNYQGKVKCFACGAILAVKIEEGNLKSLDIVQNKMEDSDHGEPVIRKY
jgi:ribosomal protein S27E